MLRAHAVAPSREGLLKSFIHSKQCCSWAIGRDSQNLGLPVSSLGSSTHSESPFPPINMWEQPIHHICTIHRLLEKWFLCNITRVNIYPDLSLVGQFMFCARINIIALPLTPKLLSLDNKLYDTPKTTDWFFCRHIAHIFSAISLVGL